MTLSYDNPNVTVSQFQAFGPTTAGATTKGAQWVAPHELKLRRVTAEVVVAGTAAGHGFDVYNGTTSVGTIALSTNTAGVVAQSAVLDVTVTALDQISCDSLADATGTANIIYEYSISDNATLAQNPG